MEAITLQARVTKEFKEKVDKQILKHSSAIGKRVTASQLIKKFFTSYLEMNIADFKKEQL